MSSTKNAHVAKQPESATGWSPGNAAGTPTLALDGCGVVGDCNCAGETLFKYRRNELLRQHVSILLPQLAELDLLEGGRINAHLRYLCRIGRHFEAVTQDSERFASELFLNLLDNRGSGRLILIVRPALPTAGKGRPRAPTSARPFLIDPLTGDA